MNKQQKGLRDVTNKLAISSQSNSSLKFGLKCDTVVEDENEFDFFQINRIEETSSKVKRLKASTSPIAEESSFSIVSRLSNQLKETVVSNNTTDDEDYSLRGALKSLASTNTPIFSDSEESDVSANSSLTFTSTSSSSSRRRLFSSSSASKQQSTPVSSLSILTPDETTSESTTATAVEEESTVEYSLRTIQSCLSMTQRHDIIMQSLEIEHSVTDTTRRLIGDKSRHHALPTLAAHTTKHADLNCITPSTLKSLLDGEFAESVGRYVIMDSRYPYEFQAGHIRGALNVFTKDALLDYCFASRDQQNQQPLVIIFHCEFSSERGPSLLRFLRSQDRAMNKDVYPHLFYPELYLLDGGYKNFFERHPDYCEPRAYKPMLHEDHIHDLKHFRAKTKTWETNNKALAYSHNHHSSAVKLETRFKKSSSRTLHRCPKSTLF